MNALVYVDIDQGIHSINSINIANFEAFLLVFKLTKNPLFLKSVAFVFKLQTLRSKDFSKLYRLKGLKPQNKGHMNFYECCVLTKKAYLVYVHVES